MDKWRESRLGDVARIIGGGTPSTKNSDNYNGKISWITPKDLSLFKQRYIKTGERFITQRGLDSSSAKLLPPNTILFTSRAPIGYIAIAKNKLSTNQGFKNLIINEKNDFLFFYYLLKYMTPRIKLFASGSTFLEINSETLKSIEIKIPEIKTQKAISHVLGTLDDKIELNQQMNETLESMAQAIFKDWFVDFGPTRRKMEGATDSDVIIGGLINSRKSNYSFELPISSEKNANIAGLFPATLSNLNLPEGWRECKVSAFGKIRGGQQLTKSEFFSDGLIPVFGGAGHMGQTNKSNVEGFIISVGRVGAYCGNFVAHRGYAWINNNASFFDLFKTTEPEWFFYALRNLKINQIRKGAAQPFVSNRDIANLTIVYPDEKILSEFQFFVVPLIKLIEENNSEKQVLIEIRDFLLQKLISGEIFIHNDETCT